MKNSTHSCHRHKKVLLAPAILSMLAFIGIIGLGGQIWADKADMTQLQFSSALFCQRVSQAINDSLGDGMADGSDCVNRNLSVSSTAIGNIQTLNIVPPEGGFGDINLEAQPISIGGEWVYSFYNLTSLSITDMYIQDIGPLGNMRGGLTHLDLSNNRIYDVSPLQEFSGTLTYLNLSSNPISYGLDEIAKFTRLTTLKMADTGLSYIDELFRPAEVEYGQEPDSSSELARVLRVFDISDNEYLSGEIEENAGECEGSLTPFSEYNLVITELYASQDNLNADDLSCVSALHHLEKLDVSDNHIDDFRPIKNNNYTMLKADSQTFTRWTDTLDYEPLPEIFAQAQQENYLQMASTSNMAVPLDELDMANAQFNGTKLRFINAAAASAYGDDPQPATLTIPSGTGVFENSKLQVYFTGQVVSFNDANLCNEIYHQGETGAAFLNVDFYSYWSADNPVVLTNACDTSKQIAMVSGGSSQFLRLTLDSLRDGAAVDLTGLEEFNNLEVLSLQNNGLTALDELTDMYGLQQLWLNDNNLGNDDWSTITGYLQNLRILYLNNNDMSEISTDLSYLYSLGDLYLVNNGISDVSPLAWVPSLTVLDLSENTGIGDFSGMVQDESACNPSILKLENAGITRLPDASIIERGFSNLTSLNLNDNQITDETIANLASAPRLDELYLNDNRIVSTSGFGNITTLRKLFIDNNQITDVSGLISLMKLVELHLGNNHISDIAGLNTLPVLATLDLKDQSLAGEIVEAESAYELPPVFAQAMTLDFPKVSGFQSVGDYTVTNGTIDYDEMAATIIDKSEAMTVTIPDGGLAGTVITITYTGDGEGGFGGTMTDHTDGGATIAITSPNSFTVTSDKACMALWTENGGTTWNRLSSSTVIGNNNMREFSTSQINGIEIVVAYAGDVNTDNNVNVRDARKIVNTIMGKNSMSSLEEALADVDGKNGVNVRDARAIVNNIMGKADIDW